MNYIGLEAPRPTRAILSKARLYGETTFSFDNVKKHLLLVGVAAALELNPSFVAIVSMETEDVKDRGGSGRADMGGDDKVLVLQLRIELPNGAAARDALARMKHRNFVLRVAAMMKENCPAAELRSMPIVSPLTMDLTNPTLQRVSPTADPGFTSKRRMSTTS